MFSDVDDDIDDKVKMRLISPRSSPTRSHLPINLFYSYISPLSHLRHTIHREGTMKDRCENIRVIIWVETVRVWEGYIADIVG